MSKTGEEKAFYDVLFEDLRTDNFERGSWGLLTTNQAFACAARLKRIVDAMKEGRREGGHSRRLREYLAKLG